jgi:hypothetical protein
MARGRILLLCTLLFVLTVQPATAQGGAFSPNSNRDLGSKSRAGGAQVECGPIGCRPLPPGCRQIRLGGRWLDNNGLSVVCDGRRS